MRWGRSAAGSPRTWLLALVFVALIDTAITRTALLWAPAYYENDLGLHVVQLGQTFKVARRLFVSPSPAGEERIVILGDSRIWFGAPAAVLERELERQAPGRGIQVEQFAIFGARIGDFEALARHLGRLDPALVVLALDGIELLPFADGGYGNWPQRTFDTGWGDNPLAAGGWQARLDRWARTVSPLYRYRLFARAALVDRVAPQPPAADLPERFESTLAVQQVLHPRRAETIDAAYQAWRAQPALASYVTYLQSKFPQPLPIDRTVPPGTTIAPDSPALAGLGHLLSELRAVAPVLIVLLPENPILDQDVAGLYHEPGFSDVVAQRIAAVAAAHDVPVADGRRWLPAEAFFDFLHPFPDVSGLQRPLATEILHVLGS